MAAIRRPRAKRARLIRVAEPDISEADIRAVVCALRAKHISAGPWVERFERTFAGARGAKHAVAVSSGTAALQLALEALQLPPGADVLVPDITFSASAAAILHAGHRPVLLECDVIDCFPHHDDVRDAMLDCDAYMAVALYGNWPPLGPRGKPAILDACEALNLYSSAYAATCYSLYGNKVITCGEGGVVCTDRDDIAKRVRDLRAHGRQTQRYVFSSAGHNFRMPDFVAALALSQLKRERAFTRRRWQIRRWYATERVPLMASGPWAAVGIVKDAKRAASALEAAGIESRPRFPPLHEMPPYRAFRFLRNSHFPEGAALLGRLLLPLHVGLTRADVARVAAVLRRAGEIA